MQLRRDWKRITNSCEIQSSSPLTQIGLRLTERDAFFHPLRQDIKTFH